MKEEASGGGVEELLTLCCLQVSRGEPGLVFTLFLSSSEQTD